MAVSLVEKLPMTGVATPWGPADGLRSRQLRPGPGIDPATVERNQSERIYGATVAVVAEHGYEAVRVADVLRVAGVSRSAFYRYFDNKLECFLATLEAIAALARAQLGNLLDDDQDGPRGDRLGALIDAVVAMIVAQPAAARVWLVEVHVAGPQAVNRVEQLAARLEALVTEAIARRPDGPGLPGVGVTAVVGGLRQIARTRVRHDRQGELPALTADLLTWALDYRPPPVPLRSPRRAPALPAPTPDPDDARRRILAAVTELAGDAGYQELTITEIVRRASISLSTFYNHFGSKQDVFLAAIDDGERQLIEATLPVYRAAPDWPRAARDTIHAFFAFNAAHPAMAQLGGARIFSSGAAGFDRHERATSRFAAMLADGHRGHPSVSPIVGEAISGAVAALLYQQIRSRGPERLYEVAGIATYLALAPFVGAIEACALANEGWRPAA
jgi:AcrR family transcriptional regulator